jgi:hypothetical protein
MSDNSLDFDIDLTPDFEKIGYKMVGSIEFYENEDTGEGGYKAILYPSSRQDDSNEENGYSEGQTMVLVAQALIEDYIEREVH